MGNELSTLLDRDGCRERAAQYRHRAEELRSIAQEWKVADAKRTLVKIAKDYERMAEVVEQSADHLLAPYQ